MIKSRCFRNDKYLKFIRQQNCIIEGHNNNIHAHHVRVDFFGAGIKPSDYRTIPLTAMRHNELHHFGERAFFRKYKISHNHLIAAYMNLFFLQQGEIKNDHIEKLEDILELIR